MSKKKRKKEGAQNKSGKEKKEGVPLIPENIKRIIIGTVLLLLTLISALGFYDLAGPVGRWLTESVFDFLFGRVAILIPVLFFFAALTYLKAKYENFALPLLISLFLLISGVSGSVSSFNKVAETENNGGWWGEMISSPLIGLLDIYVTQIIFVVSIFAGVIILINLISKDFSITEALKGTLFSDSDLEPSTVKKTFLSPEKESKEEKEEKPSEKEKKGEEEKEETIETKRRKDRPLLVPPLNLLKNGGAHADPGDTRRNASIIKKTFSDFDISVTMGEVNVGPAVTQYTLKPAEGVKLSKITSLADDLALSLAMHPVRTEAPIPGKSLVGIEVPNRKRAQVTLANLVKNKNFFETSALTFAVGKDVSGNPVFSDLAKMPHMLVAGSTGSGKTIFLNTFLFSLLYKNSPDDMRLILVDPKRVEFSLYANLPHLLTPVIYDADRTSNALSWLIGEMERRFKVLSEVGSRNISSYQELCKKDDKLERMPYIVLVVDELADLMATKSNEMEAGIVRIAQMARAVGIHLVLATQRPSVEVITGLIKANITARASFRVASQVDSRTILDCAGAEKLLGAGDMLFLSTENSKPRRIQAPFLTEEEVKNVTRWLIENQESREDDPLAENLEESLEKGGGKEGAIDPEDDDDALYEDAKQIVISSGKASASLLQRRLRVGYARAARLLDILESRGVVGPAEGAKPREVYGEERNKQNEGKLMTEEGGDDSEDDWKKV